MANIVIRMQNIGAYDSGDNIFYTGIARCSGMTSADSYLSWNVLLGSSSLAATINDAIKTAAIAAASDAGITVGALDKKTLIGAAMDL